MTGKPQIYTKRSRLELSRDLLSCTIKPCSIYKATRLSNVSWGKAKDLIVDLLADQLIVCQGRYLLITERGKTFLGLFVMLKDLAPITITDFEGVNKRPDPSELSELKSKVVIEQRFRDPTRRTPNSPQNHQEDQSRPVPRIESRTG